MIPDNKMIHVYTSAFRTNIILVMAIVLLSISFSGCSAPSKTDDVNTVEKWLERAEEFRAYSPAPREREIPEKQIFQKMEDEKHEDDRSRLPQDLVNLNFRDVDIRVLLRALASVAEQNIVMSNNVQGSMSVELRDIPWDQAFLSVVRTNALSYSWEGDIIRIQSMDDIDKDIQLRNTQRRAQELRTTVLDLKYAHVNDNGEDLRDHLQNVLDTKGQDEQRGMVLLDKINNSLVIQATDEDTRRVLHVFNHLDRSRPQIHIEASIIETTRSTARMLGLQWGGQYRSERIHGDERLYIAPGDQNVLNFPADIEDIGVNLDVMYGIMGGNLLEMQLTALETQGKLNIISAPSITTLDGQMASTLHGARIPYPEWEYEEERRVEGTSFTEAALSLDVLPRVIDNERMRMNIVVHKDEPDFTNAVLGRPLIQTKSTETNLVVRDGETIVISGLSKQTLSEDEAGVPGLRNLPGLGWLFKSREKKDEMEEFMIFLTPTILERERVFTRE